MNCDGRTLFTRLSNARAHLRKTSRLLSAMAVVLFCLGPGSSAAVARDWYVAPTGLASNDGSIASPIDLATALSGMRAVAGDTIWLRGGTYVGAFTSNLTGTPSAPVTVRQFPGERATIDARSTTDYALVVNGAYATYWGFEVTNSSPTRSTIPALTIYGSYTKFINMIVHEGGAQGVGFWTPAVGAELYGMIIYNNGFDGGDRGYGHSVYTQNQTGVKLISDNIMFNSFSFGIHAYTQGGAIDNFQMEGNILFNHGMASSISGAKSNLLLGGGKVAYNPVIKNNYSYYPRGAGGRGADIGYGVACANALVFDNYFVGDTSINFNCSGSTVSNNQLYGPVNSNISLSSNNTIYASRPTGVQTYVRPNRYEPGRAHIAIYNWDLLPQVSVDLSQAQLTNGQAFEIRDALNFFGPAVVISTYTGQPVTIPMTGLTAVAPIAARPFVHTAPEFGAFVLIPVGGSSGIVASISASPNRVLAGQSATLSWGSANASSISIDQGIGAVPGSGSRTVTPAATTTFTLTAADGSGNSVTKTAVVEVLTPSPDGATSPPLSALVEPDGTVWSLGSNGNTLRNGVWVGGGFGTKLLWLGGVIYVFGTDGNWWQWLPTPGSWVMFAGQPTGGGATPASPSADGAMVPPLAQVVDAAGAAWSIGAAAHILRNGAWAGGGLGTKLLWFGGSIYTLGTDANWWQWVSSSWVKLGPTQPGTAPAGPSPSSPSADGSMVPPLSQLVDASGAVWTIGTNNHTLRNGLWAGSGSGTKLLWSSGSIYTFGTDGNWWRWASNSWLNVGPTQPGVTSGTPTPSSASADGSMVPPLAQLVDSTGAVWTIGAGNHTLRNGAWAGYGLGTKLLWSGGSIYTFGTDGNWWRWASSSWVNVGPTQPGTTSGTPTSSSASPDGSMVPPLAQLVDSSGAIWTIGINARTLRNGTWAGGGQATKLLWYAGAVYAYGTDGNWWQWQTSSPTWFKVGPTQPGTTP